MKKFYFLIAILIFSFTLNAITVENGKLTDFIYGSDENLAYDDFVSHISEGIAQANYNYYAEFDPQTNGFGDYTMPSSQDLTNWNDIMLLFVAQDFEAAQTALDSNNYPYEVVEFHDTDTGNTYYLIRENLNNSYVDDNIDSDPDDDVTGSFDYGWGLYVFNPDASNPIIITAPHPNDDYISVPIALKCFQDWDSMFMIVSSIGREVKWSNQAPYYNSKSTCDPTRVANHPFNKGYQRFCDHIREQFGRVEFSTQIHSYDWNDRHPNRANCQVSAGSRRYNPNLPIRDLANSGIDMFNKLDDIVYPANTFGVHREVSRNDFIAAHCKTNPFDIGGDPENPANTDVDLWGYSQSSQMSYTFNYDEGNDYDVFDPWFHIEMDELPECYDQTEANYNWFYGYDIATQKFSKEHRFDMLFNYYGLWVDTLTEILDDFLNVRTQDIDGASDIPQNLIVTGQNENAVSLYWEPVTNYNFKSYEVMYSLHDANEYTVWDREDDSKLADMLATNTTINGLEASTEYDFKIRTVDYTDLRSQESDVVTITTSNFNFTSFTSKGLDSQIDLTWGAYSQNEISEYKLYRRERGESDWQLHDTITGDGEDSATYEYSDVLAVNGHYYEYKIEAVDNDDNVYLVNDVVNAQASDYITLRVANGTDSVFDEVIFSINEDATDGYENKYDVTTTTSGSGSSYVVAWFNEPYYSYNTPKNFSTNIKGDTDLSENVKEFRIKVKSNLTGQVLHFELQDYDENRSSKKVWLKESSNNYVDLTEENLSFAVTNANEKSFFLYYGDVNPTVTLGTGIANTILHPETSARINWNYSNDQLLQSYSLDIISKTDSINIVTDNTDIGHYYDWNIPADTQIEDANIVMTYTAQDGEVSRVVSDWTTGILTEEQEYNFTAGWSMVSHNWQSDAPTMNDLFGTGASIYELANEIYEPTLTYSFGKGYWLNLSEDNSANITGTIPTDDVTINITTGWNLIGNPYPTSTDLSALMFLMDGEEMTIGEMITYGYIDGAFYGHDEMGWKEITTLDKMDAFMLHSNLEIYNTVTATFTPYKHHYQLNKKPLDWSIKVIAESPNDKDNIVCGLSERFATNGYDRDMDYIKPMNKPYDGVDVYHKYEESAEQNYVKGHTDVKNSFAENDQIEWDIAVNARTEDPIILTYSGDNFDEQGYFAYISYNDELHKFDSLHPYTFNPPTVGEHLFKVVVSTVVLGDENNSEPISNVFNIYPNPFNPETNIRYSVKNNGNVKIDVYNLRGQKVKTLVNQNQKAGVHNIVWHGTNQANQKIASGIYFVRVKTDDQKTRIKKIMMLK